MKQFFVKIAAVTMAFVVLFSTMSFSISKHYCGDYLVDSALFSKAESCGMDSDNYREQNTLPNRDCNLTKSNCCEDVVKLIEGQNELKTNVSALNFEQQVFIASFVYSYINLFEGIETNIIPFRYYTPPLLVKDIQVLDEVFLI